MKALLIAPLFLTSALAVHAQPAAGSDAAPTRAERKAEARDAARNFKPGEGNPEPEARARTTRAQRAAARAARKPVGAEAARETKTGEGDPVPEATPKVARADRKAANAARRASIRAANKAGQIPSYAEDYGTKK
ncbi:Uncharacterised protein [Xylophilus ampelinus]|nr:hypothetical protein [Variovorax sp.]VTY25663.1 Uncharacterised protein [Xylophilus ampelinus]